MKPAPVPMALPLRVIVWIVGAAIAGLLVVLFAFALPEAVARAKAGSLRNSQVACENLKPTPASPRLGQFPVPAPDFTLKNFRGNDISLSSLQGQVVLVNFWATWCPTCVVEMPSMEKLVTRLEGRPFRLLAVSVDEAWPQIRSFFAKGTPLEILLDADKAVAGLYGTEKFPESFIVDKRGQIRYFVVSDRDWSKPDVQTCIESLMAE